MTSPISEALKLRPYPTTLVLLPSGSSEICHRRAGPSFLPRDTHLHNTLLTAALGRPINRKSQAKESRLFLCPHLGEISRGSLSVTAPPLARPPETTSLPTSCRGAPSRSFLHSEKNETLRALQYQISEKSTDRMLSLNARLPGPCQFAHRGTGCAQTALGHLPGPTYTPDGFPAMLTVTAEHLLTLFSLIIPPPPPPLKGCLQQNQDQ